MNETPRIQKEIPFVTFGVWNLFLQRIIRQHTLFCVIIFLYLKRRREGR